MKTRFSLEKSSISAELKSVVADIIDISKSVGIDAKIIGEVLKSQKKKLSIQSELGNFEY